MPLQKDWSPGSSININAFRSPDDYITFEVVNKPGTNYSIWKEYYEYQNNESGDIRNNHVLLLCIKLIEQNKGLFYIDFVNNDILIIEKEGIS